MVFSSYVTVEVNTESKLTHFTLIIHVLGLIVNDSLVKLILKKYLIPFFWILEIPLTTSSHKK